jgi:hypothetical protein
MKNYRKLIEWNGQAMTAGAWSRTEACQRKRISRALIAMRMLNGWTPDAALTTPPLPIVQKRTTYALQGAELDRVVSRWRRNWAAWMDEQTC